MDLWKAGFKESGGSERILSGTAFRNLLNEMVGLGILRRTSKSEHYALRSPNVVNLLGHRNQIEDVLLSSGDWEPAGEYEPQVFAVFFMKTINPFAAL
jgi:hypothetical protein